MIRIGITYTAGAAFVLLLGRWLGVPLGSEALAFDLWLVVAIWALIGAFAVEFARLDEADRRRSERRDP